MRIGVDVHLTNGMFQGSRRYVESMYRAAAEKLQSHDLFFATHPTSGLDGAWRQMGTIVDFDTHSSAKRLTMSASRLARRYEFDAFHFQAVAPIFCSCPVALTVHDILPDTHPEFFTRKFVASRKVLYRLGVRKASVVFTVSEYSKAALQERYGTDPAKIVVTPNGVDANLFHARDRDDSCQLVREQFGLSDYLLTVGRLEPRKNHLTLLNAYHELCQRKRNPPPLVIVGQRDFHYEAIFQRIQELQLDQQVVVMENVGNEMLPHLYRAASLFVYVSWAEGFGIPPLEAMACGCPVIAANTTAIPDVVGSAGCLLPPDDVQQLATTIDRILSDGEKRASMSAAGIGRAAQFTWEASAQKMVEGLERLRR